MVSIAKSRSEAAMTMFPKRRPFMMAGSTIAMTWAKVPVKALTSSPNTESPVEAMELRR